ncbi:acidic repeat-containing protein-like [Papaver somniferum]|uniref:acidic repeat-containing protein-like n=1 Tax=Papaver somniferum TaxID=3469 RepID=UPI000E6F6935|nr:acidic repeat-containing protein-like [Papaver somniferum]
MRLSDAVKEKLCISDMQRKELDEDLTEVQERQERLFNFIEEKSLKFNEVGLMNLTEREVEEEEEHNEDGDMHDDNDDDDDDDDDKEGAKGGDMHDDNDDDDDDDDEKGDKGGDMHQDDNEKEGSKGGDMHGDDNDKEGSKGGDDKHGTESEKNEVPVETPEKRSTPLSKTNEEKDVKGGTRQGVESGTAKKPSTSLPETAAIAEDQEDQDVMDATQTAEIDEATIIASQDISQMDPKGMLPVEEQVLLLTQEKETENETYTSIEDLLDNLSENVFVKLEKGCYRTTPSEVKEKITTLIRHECPSFSLLSQEDPKENSS